MTGDVVGHQPQLGPVRFDAANTALGNGKFKGTVFSDNAPRLELHLSGAGYDKEAPHVDDVLHHPEHTFPTIIGKNAPGDTPDDALHRLMDKDKSDANNAASVAICTDIWGPGYAAGGMECDEYPFKSTYEGSSVSTDGHPGNWHGSARRYRHQTTAKAAPSSASSTARAAFSTMTRSP